MTRGHVAEADSVAPLDYGTADRVLFKLNLPELNMVWASEPKVILQLEQRTDTADVGGWARLGRAGSGRRTRRWMSSSGPPTTLPSAAR